MSRGELELLSVLAGAPRRLLFIWKPFRHLMLFRGQNFSFICPHFLLPQWDAGLRGGASPASEPGYHTPHCVRGVGWHQEALPPGADVQARVLPRGILRTCKSPVSGRAPGNRAETEA